MFGARVKQASLIMDTRSSERDLDHLFEKGRVAGDRLHQESLDREAPIDELEAIGILGILGTSDLCTSKVRTVKPRWRVWSKAYGSGHLDQGLVKGLARKAHRQSELKSVAVLLSRLHYLLVIIDKRKELLSRKVLEWLWWKFSFT